MHAAYHRYLLRDGDEFQQGNLLQAGSVVPPDAVAVTSGTYFLTAGQVDWIHDGTPKARAGRDIPAKVQKECNDAGRVAYALVAESDALEDGVKVETIIEWLSTFVEDWLGVEEYSFYYSGNRSIHLHTDTFVTANTVDDLRRLANQFNEIHDADLDTGIYSQNQQFRLVGAQHRKTEFYKVPIDASASLEDCIRSAQKPVKKEWPFSLPAPNHHATSRRPTLAPHSSISYSPSSHYRAGIADWGPLPSEFGGGVLRGVYKGRATFSGESNQKWSKTASHFSPYKKTGGEDGRSVIVMEQLEGLLQNRRTRDIYVPAHIKYAVGGGDGSFTRGNSDSLVRLSRRDCRKWEYEEGDAIVLIGGNSGSSRILKVDGITKRLVATALKSRGREKALQILVNRGFDVGSNGYNPSQYHRQETGGEESEAAKIKRGIEEGTREKTYENILSVTCRLLKREGWDAAYHWCMEVFGPEFNPEKTHEKLERMVDAYDDYSHVDVPEALEENS